MHPLYFSKKGGHALIGAGALIRSNTVYISHVLSLFLCHITFSYNLLTSVSWTQIL